MQRILTILVAVGFVTGYSQSVVSDSMTMKTDVQRSGSILRIYETKEYKNGKVQSDSVIFYESLCTLIDTVRLDTSLTRTVTYIRKPDNSECLELISGYNTLKTDDYSMALINRIRNKPTINNNPFDEVLFLKLVKYKGEYLINEGAWFALWFTKGYLFKSCYSCEGNCMSLHGYSRDESSGYIYSGHMDSSNSDTSRQTFCFKIIDPQRKIYVAKCSFWGNRDKAMVDYYTPLSEICNFRFLINRSWDVRSGRDNKPFEYNLDLDECEW